MKSNNLIKDKIYLDTIENKPIKYTGIRNSDSQFCYEFEYVMANTYETYSLTGIAMNEECLKYFIKEIPEKVRKALYDKC